ncbi:MAG: hypothetical protein ABSF67_22595 [Roseiarcus sp.]|jgi:hypothetical protein
MACDPKAAEWLVDHFDYESDDEDDANAPPLASQVALWRVQKLARERGVDPMTIIAELFPDELARLGRPVAPPCNLPKTKRRVSRANKPKDLN